MSLFFSLCRIKVNGFQTILDTTDFHFEDENILQNIFCFPLKKDCHTPLELHDGDNFDITIFNIWVNCPFKLRCAYVVSYDKYLFDSLETN